MWYEPFCRLPCIHCAAQVPYRSLGWHHARLNTLWFMPPIHIHTSWFMPPAFASHCALRCTLALRARCSTSSILNDNMTCNPCPVPCVAHCRCCRPAHALHFAVYEWVKDRLGGNEAGHSSVLAGIAGGVATCVNDAVMTPADVIKQRLQVRCGKLCNAGTMRHVWVSILINASCTLHTLRRWLIRRTRG
jgi:hypothetical protein